MLNLLQQRQIKRIPVIEDHRLVGVISEADLARNPSQDQLGHFVDMLTAVTNKPAPAGCCVVERSGVSGSPDLGL